MLTCQVSATHNLADVKGEHKPKWASPSCGLSWLLRSSSLPAVVGSRCPARIKPKRRYEYDCKFRSVTSPPPSVAGGRRPSSMSRPRERRLPPPAFRMENPFSVKVLQVFTGFGVGCGVGIGVGRPIYLGNDFFQELILV